MSVATTETRMVDAPLTQKQVQSVAHSNGRVNVWDGSVRSGKTVGSLLRWLLHIDNAPESGELVISGKTVQTVYRNLILPLMDRDLFGPLAGAVVYTLGAPTAYILGQPVHVVGANDAKAEQKIRGMTVRGAYIDEATLVPKDFFMTMLARMSVPGARLFATTNPDTPAHWLRKDILLSGDPQTRRFRFKIDDNTFLDPDFVSWLKSTYKGLYYRRNILGHWVVAEGAVYDMFDHRRHIVDILPAIQDWLAVAVDYGTKNPFHALLIGLGADQKLYVAAEWRWDSVAQQRQLTDSQYADAVENWLAQLRKKGGRFTTLDQPRFWIVDPSATSFRAELRQRGLIQAAAVNDVIDGIRVTAMVLGRGQLKIHRSCTHLIDEISGYSWDDKAALLGEDKPIKADDHGPDALRYGVRTTQKLWTPFLEAA